MRGILRPLCIAGLVFAALYFGANLYTNYRPLMPGQGLAIFLWNLDAFLAPVVAGYVAAQLFRSQHIAMGAAAGLLAGLIAVVTNVFQTGPESALHRALGILGFSVVMGAVGGLVSWLQARLLRWARPAAADTRNS